MEITFDQLPKFVSQIHDKLDKIEELLLSRSEVLQPEADKYLTIKETAQFLHLTVPTIYILVQKAEIPVCKRSGRLFFLQSEIAFWIKGGRKKTVSERDEKVDTYLTKSKRRK